MDTQTRTDADDGRNVRHTLTDAKKEQIINVSRLPEGKDMRDVHIKLRQITNKHDVDYRYS